MKNKYGLSRDPAPNIKYIIRKDDYFGCVHCGLGIYQYEHIDPEYKDSKEHDPKKMTLLCPTEHYKVTHYFTAKETVWKWKKNPWSKQHGHCHDKFDLTSDVIEIWVGAAKVEKFEKIISIDNECVLSILPPEETGGTFRLSAIFHDNLNQPILEIKDNEWKALSTAFDIVTSQGKIGIRKDGKFALKIFTFPPNKIVIEEIDMFYKGLEIKADSKSLKVNGPLGGGIQLASLVQFTATEAGSSLINIYTDRPGVNIGKGQISTLSEQRPLKNLTVHNCRRNEDCPCGKKKKYKNCCMPKYDYTL